MMTLTLTFWKSSCAFGLEILLAHTAWAQSAASLANFFTPSFRKQAGPESAVWSDSFPNAGLHMLTIAHYREPLAGFHEGAAYQETSHNCSLTWRQ